MKFVYGHPSRAGFTRQPALSRLLLLWWWSLLSSSTREWPNRIGGGGGGGREVHLCECVCMCIWTSGSQEMAAAGGREAFDRRLFSHSLSEMVAPSALWRNRANTRACVCGTRAPAGFWSWPNLIWKLSRSSRTNKSTRRTKTLSQRRITRNLALMSMTMSPVCCRCCCFCFCRPDCATVCQILLAAPLSWPCAHCKVCVCVFSSVRMRARGRK